MALFREANIVAALDPSLPFPLIALVLDYVDCETVYFILQIPDVKFRSLEELPEQCAGSVFSSSLFLLPLFFKCFCGFSEWTDNEPIQGVGDLFAARMSDGSVVSWGKNVG